MNDLKERIRNEMVVDHANALEKNFEIAKRLLSITTEGKIHMNIDKRKLSGKQLILLYLIGKVYAKLADLSENDYATNKELMDELGLPDGSISGYLSQLNEENKVRVIKKGAHKIVPNLIEKTLIEISSKLEGG